MGVKIGIIIPSYNQGKYIEAAICSVLENKKHADITIALMDGGSCDETKDIIQKYQDKLDVWCYKSKNYSLYTKKELSIIGEELCLRFNTHPKNSKKLNFIATITFDDGEVFSDIVEVEF